MDLSVPIAHNMIHCKFKLCKTKVCLTHRHINIRIENSYAGVLEAASDSGSTVHAVVLTISSTFLILRIEEEKEPRDIPSKILVELLGGNYGRSKYHRSTTDNHDISNQ